MKKSKIALISALTFVLISVFVFAIILINSDKIILIKSESYFSDFEVKNQKVYIKCHVTIENTFKDDKKITLLALMQEDVSTGLLKSANIVALDNMGKKIEYFIPKNSKISFDVVFIGNYAYKILKTNRELPNIKINIIQ